MTIRSGLAWLVVALLCVAQMAALTGFLAWLLSAPAVPALPRLFDDLMRGLTPWAALSAISAAVVLGPVAAVAMWRLHVSGLAAGLLVAPLLVPLGLLASPMGLGLGVTVASHASVGLALGALCGVASLAWLDLGVLRAAACSGVSPWGAVRRVVLPVMAPGILASALLAGAVSVVFGLTRVALAVPDFAMIAPVRLVWLAALGCAVLLCAIAAAGLILMRRP
jgi:ABC-type spermidine/putrescine transport system permease subunit II